MNDHAKQFNDYGTKKISFAQFAKEVWEDNQYDVIIEPAGLYWYEMAKHWKKTRFIQLVSDPERWENSLKNWMKTILNFEKGSSIDMQLYNNEHLSKTGHFGLHKDSA